MFVHFKLIFQEKRDKERLFQLELIKYEEEISGEPSKTSVSSAELTQGAAELMPKLVILLPADKITGMMSVRKGRVRNLQITHNFENF